MEKFQEEFQENHNFWWNLGVGLLIEQKMNLQESQQKASWAIHEATNCQEFLTLLKQVIESNRAKKN